MPEIILSNSAGIPESLLSQITATESDVTSGKIFLNKEGLITTGSLVSLSGNGTCLAIGLGSAPSGTRFAYSNRFDATYMQSSNTFAKACKIRFYVIFGHEVYLNTVKIQVGSQVLFHQQMSGGYRTIDRILNVNAGDTISIVGTEARPQTSSVYFYQVTLAS